MIEICRLTKRQVEPTNNNMPSKYEQVKVFSMAVGHGVGTIDFVEKVAQFDEEKYLAEIHKCGPYAQFKLGNLSKYFEIEVFPEHLEKLKTQMPQSDLKNLLFSLKEGYWIIRKQR